MYRPSKNQVIARESLPALFRPSNQMRLVQDHSANPSPSDPQSMLPGMGEVRLGNGQGSNGLVSGSADARFAKNVLDMRLNQAQRGAMIQAAGSPNGKSRPFMTLSLARAMADMPSAPSQGALEVDLAWAGNSLQSEQWEVRNGLQLRPLKAFGKLQTYVTSVFGTDAAALRDALEAQPIVSVQDIREYVPATVTNPTAPRMLWEHVDTIERPGGMRWIITKVAKLSGPERYCATLYRHRADSEDEVVRSDNLASELTARQYIKSYEVGQGDFGGAGRLKRTIFWNGIDRQGGDAGMQNTMARSSRAGFSVINAPDYADQPDQGTNGLGFSWGRTMRQIALPVHAQPIVATAQKSAPGYVKHGQVIESTHFGSGNDPLHALQVQLASYQQALDKAKAALAIGVKYRPKVVPQLRRDVVQKQQAVAAVQQSLNALTHRTATAVSGLGEDASLPLWAVAAAAIGAVALLTSNRIK